jgi:hypothetical protein
MNGFCLEEGEEASVRLELGRSLASLREGGLLGRRSLVCSDWGWGIRRGRCVGLPERWSFETCSDG